ncbi:MAG: hypothetical protein KF851_10645 [Pirellulaceae bacterium]|jgi:Tfp pilus assembly protein PilO|nr:hypothetical protein [Pirellulaceae bacterium]
MNMNRRNLLIALFAVAVGGYFVNMLAERYYFQPLAQEARQTTTLEKRLREAKLQLQKLENKVPRRDDFEQRSLPPNPEIASSIYQAWLLNTVTQLGLANPVVDSTSPVEEGDVTRLPFNVKGKANLRQLTQFLYEFYRAGHLQKINQITLTPSASGERLEVQIGIEALSLNRSKNEKELPQLTSERLVHDTLDPYLVIVQRNLFSEGAAPQILKSTRLTAITQDRFGRNEAWFYVDTLRKTHILAPGDMLDLDIVSFKLLAIDTDFVTLELEGQKGRLDLGKSLSELRIAGTAQPQASINRLFQIARIYLRD